jgi:short-subunit dehydrogenase
MNPLIGEHAIVTGASRGIGAHVAVALAARGVHLTLAARSAEELEQVAEACRAHGVRAETVACDLTTENGRAAVVAAAEAAPIAPSILVNNAGTELLGPYHRATPSAIEGLIKLNLVSPMLLTRAVLPAMVLRKKGHVVNLASMAGKAGTPFAATYTATKAGLVGATSALRAEYRGTGVSFSVICPVFVTGAGMFNRLGEDRVKIPRVIGTVSVNRVVAAVVKAIEKDKPEVLLGSPTMRPLLALGQLAPRAHGAIAARVRVTERFQKFLGDAIGDPAGELDGMQAKWSGSPNDRDHATAPTGGAADQ